MNKSKNSSRARNARSNTKSKSRSTCHTSKSRCKNK